MKGLAVGQAKWSAVGPPIQVDEPATMDRPGAARCDCRQRSLVDLLLVYILARRAILQTQGTSWEESPGSSHSNGSVGVSWPEAFSPDGAELVISEPESVSLWDAGAGRKRATWTMPGGRRVYEGIFCRDGRTFGALTWGGPGQPLMIDLVDVATGQVRASLPTPCDGLVGLAFTEKGQNLRAVVSHAVGSTSPSNPVVIDSNVTSGRVTSTRELSCPPCGVDRVSRDGRLLAFAFSPANPAAGPWSHVMLWDLDQDHELARLPGDADVRALAFVPDGRTLAVGRQGAPSSSGIWRSDLSAPRFIRTRPGSTRG